MARTPRSAPATAAVRDHFSAALDALSEQLKLDRSILAAILCGSLSHDKVWSKSDIDLVLVSIDDNKADNDGLCLYADGINVHAFITPRAHFRKTAEGSIGNSFMHSLLAKGKLLYTHDESITALFERLQRRGGKDNKLQLLAAACHALPSVYKAHKWLVTRGDLDYTAVWILYSANALARMQVLEAGMLADREVLPKALELNPAFFKIVYSDLMNSPKTRRGVEAALSAIDDYLLQRARTIFAPVFEHLLDVGEARSASEIEHHFKQNHGISGITVACEYLADQELIGKASVPVRLTRRSNISVQETAFFSGAGRNNEAGVHDAW